MPEWKLRFSTREIGDLVSRNEVFLQKTPGWREEDVEVVAIGKNARRMGEYSRPDFLQVCNWKSPRTRPRCERNRPEEVTEITRFALSTKAERLRIESLQCLHGVGYPTASVLLHLAHRDPYPILDVRALWSWGFDQVPAYTFEFWWEYVQHCRQLAKSSNVSMRTFDRALWMYSYENQGPLP